MRKNKALVAALAATRAAYAATTKADRVATLEAYAAAIVAARAVRAADAIQIKKQEKK